MTSPAPQSDPTERSFAHRNQNALRLAAVALVLASASTTSLRAEDDDLDNIGIFFRIGGTVRAGVKAEILDIAPAVNHSGGSFDDGFVRPDAGGSTTDTWNWGFNSQSQLSGNQMSLHKTDGAPRVGNLGSLGDSTLFGGELIGGFEMTRARIGKREVRFGFEVGYGYAPFSAKTSATATSTATYTSSVYSLGGITPPATPSYSGTFDGAGPVIPLEPISSTSVDAVGTSTLNASLETDLHTLKVGPWFDVPITKHLVLGASFGLASIYATSELTLAESTSYAGGTIPAPALLNSRVTRNDWRPGAYLQLRGTYEFNRHLGVFVGGDFQWNKDMSFSGSGREVRLKFEGTYGASAGLNLRF